MIQVKDNALFQSANPGIITFINTDGLKLKSGIIFAPIKPVNEKITFTGSFCGIACEGFQVVPVITHIPHHGNTYAVGYCRLADLRYNT
jgi:hypothetical protein